MTAKALAKWVLLDKHLQLAHELGVRSGLDLGLDPLLEDSEA
jgi:hypothetical protein